MSNSSDNNLRSSESTKYSTPEVETISSRVSSSLTMTTTTTTSTDILSELQSDHNPSEHGSNNYEADKACADFIRTIMACSDSDPVSGENDFLDELMRPSLADEIPAASTTTSSIAGGSAAPPPCPSESGPPPPTTSGSSSSSGKDDTATSIAEVVRKAVAEGNEALILNLIQGKHGSVPAELAAHLPKTEALSANTTAPATTLVNSTIQTAASRAAPSSFQSVAPSSFQSVPPVLPAFTITGLPSQNPTTTSGIYQLASNMQLYSVAQPSTSLASGLISSAPSATSLSQAATRNDAYGNSEIPVGGFQHMLSQELSPPELTGSTVAGGPSLPPPPLPTLAPAIHHHQQHTMMTPALSTPLLQTGYMTGQPLPTTGPHVRYQVVGTSQDAAATTVGGQQAAIPANMFTFSQPAGVQQMQQVPISGSSNPPSTMIPFQYNVPGVGNIVFQIPAQLKPGEPLNYQLPFAPGATPGPIFAAAAAPAAAAPTPAQTHQHQPVNVGAGIIPKPVAPPPKAATPAPIAVSVQPPPAPTAVPSAQMTTFMGKKMRAIAPKPSRSVPALAPITPKTTVGASVVSVQQLHDVSLDALASTSAVMMPDFSNNKKKVTASKSKKKKVVEPKLTVSNVSAGQPMQFPPPAIPPPSQQQQQQQAIQATYQLPQHHPVVQMGYQPTYIQPVAASQQLQPAAYVQSAGPEVVAEQPGHDDILALAWQSANDSEGVDQVLGLDYDENVPGAEVLDDFLRQMHEAAAAADATSQGDGMNYATVDAVYEQQMQLASEEAQVGGMEAATSVNQQPSAVQSPAKKKKASSANKKTTANKGVSTTKDSTSPKTGDKPPRNRSQSKKPPVRKGAAMQPDAFTVALAGLGSPKMAPDSSGQGQASTQPLVTVDEAVADRAAALDGSEQFTAPISAGTAAVVPGVPEMPPRTSSPRPQYCPPVSSAAVAHNVDLDASGLSVEIVEQAANEPVNNPFDLLTPDIAAPVSNSESHLPCSNQFDFLDSISSLDRTLDFLRDSQPSHDARETDNFTLETPICAQASPNCTLETPNCTLQIINLTPTKTGPEEPLTHPPVSPAQNNLFEPADDCSSAANEMRTSDDQVDVAEDNPVLSESDLPNTTEVLSQKLAAPNSQSNVFEILRPDEEQNSPPKSPHLCNIETNLEEQSLKNTAVENLSKEAEKLLTYTDFEKSELNTEISQTIIAQCSPGTAEEQSSTNNTTEDLPEVVPNSSQEFLPSDASQTSIEVLVGNARSSSPGNVTNTFVESSPHNLQQGGTSPNDAIENSPQEVRKIDEKEMSALCSHECLRNTQNDSPRNVEDTSARSSPVYAAESASHNASQAISSPANIEEGLVSKTAVADSSPKSIMESLSSEMLTSGEETKLTTVSEADADIFAEESLSSFQEVLPQHSSAFHIDATSPNSDNAVNLFDPTDMQELISPIKPSDRSLDKLDRMLRSCERFSAGKYESSTSASTTAQENSTGDKEEEREKSPSPSRQPELGELHVETYDKDDLAQIEETPSSSKENNTVFQTTSPPIETTPKSNNILTTPSHFLPTFSSAAAATFTFEKADTFLRFVNTDLPSFGDMISPSNTTVHVADQGAKTSPSGWYNHKGLILESPAKPIFSDIDIDEIKRRQSIEITKGRRVPPKRKRKACGNKKKKGGKKPRPADKNQILEIVEENVQDQKASASPAEREKPIIPSSPPEDNPHPSELADQSPENVYVEETVKQSPNLPPSPQPEVSPTYLPCGVSESHLPESQPAVTTKAPPSANPRPKRPTGSRKRRSGKSWSKRRASTRPSKQPVASNSSVEQPEGETLEYHPAKSPLRQPPATPPQVHTRESPLRQSTATPPEVHLVESPLRQPLATSRELSLCQTSGTLPEIHSGESPLRQSSASPPKVDTRESQLEQSAATPPEVHLMESPLRQPTATSPEFHSRESPFRQTCGTPPEVHSRKSPLRQAPATSPERPPSQTPLEQADDSPLNKTFDSVTATAGSPLFSADALEEVSGSRNDAPPPVLEREMIDVTEQPMSSANVLKEEVEPQPRYVSVLRLKMSEIRQSKKKSKSRKKNKRIKRALTAAAADYVVPPPLPVHVNTRPDPPQAPTPQPPAPPPPSVAVPVRQPPIRRTHAACGVAPVRCQDNENILSVRKFRTAAGVANKKIFSTAREERRGNNAQFRKFWQSGKVGPSRRIKQPETVTSLITIPDQPSSSGLTGCAGEAAAPPAMPPPVDIPVPKRKRGRPPKKAITVLEQQQQIVPPPPPPQPEPEPEPEVNQTESSTVIREPLKMRIRIPKYPVQESSEDEESGEVVGAANGTVTSPREVDSAEETEEDEMDTTFGSHPMYDNAGEVEVFYESNSEDISRVKNRSSLRVRRHHRRHDGGDEGDGAGGEKSGRRRRHHHHHQQQKAASSGGGAAEAPEPVNLVNNSQQQPPQSLAEFAASLSSQDENEQQKQPQQQELRAPADTDYPSLPSVITFSEDQVHDVLEQLEQQRHTTKHITHNSNGAAGATVSPPKKRRYAGDSEGASDQLSSKMTRLETQLPSPSAIPSMLDLPPPSVPTLHLEESGSSRVNSVPPGRTSSHSASVENHISSPPNHPPFYSKEMTSPVRAPHSAVQNAQPKNNCRMEADQSAALPPAASASKTPIGWPATPGCVYSSGSSTAAPRPNSREENDFGRLFAGTPEASVGSDNPSSVSSHHGGYHHENLYLSQQQMTSNRCYSNDLQQTTTPRLQHHGTPHHHQQQRRSSGSSSPLKQPMSVGGHVDASPSYQSNPGSVPQQVYPQANHYSSGPTSNQSVPRSDEEAVTVDYNQCRLGAGGSGGGGSARGSGKTAGTRNSSRKEPKLPSTELSYEENLPDIRSGLQQRQQQPLPNTTTRTSEAVALNGPSTNAKQRPSSSNSGGGRSSRNPTPASSTSSSMRNQTNHYESSSPAPSLSAGLWASVYSQPHAGHPAAAYGFDAEQMKAYWSMLSAAPRNPYESFYMGRFHHQNTQPAHGSGGPMQYQAGHGAGSNPWEHVYPGHGHTMGMYSEYPGHPVSATGSLFQAAAAHQMFHGYSGGAGSAELMSAGGPVPPMAHQSSHHTPVGHHPQTQHTHGAAGYAPGFTPNHLL